MGRIYSRAIDIFNKNVNPDIARGSVAQLPYQSDSSATTVADLKAAFNDLLDKLRDNGYMSEFNVYPEAQTSTLLGKLVSDLQTDVAVKFGVGDEPNKITGTLNWVTGYTQFSGDTDKQKGNFLAIHFDVEDYTKCKFMLTNGDVNAFVALDNDKNAVIRVKNPAIQKVIVALFDGTTETNRIVFSLEDLVCTAEPTSDDDDE